MSKKYDPLKANRSSRSKALLKPRSAKLKYNPLKANKSSFVTSTRKPKKMAVSDKRSRDVYGRGAGKNSYKAKERGERGIFGKIFGGYLGKSRGKNGAGDENNRERTVGSAEESSGSRGDISLGSAEESSGKRGDFSALSAEEMYQREMEGRYSEGIFLKEMDCVKEAGQRYVLKTRWSKRPVFVVGLNPSMADETREDPTSRKVKKIAEENGFDGVKMVNLCPTITANPDELPEEIDEKVYQGNISLIKWEIREFLRELPEGEVVVFLMYGDGISKREYLRRSRDEILELFPAGTKFVCIGKTKAGNPVHPLYKSGESRFFDINSMI